MKLPGMKPRPRRSYDSEDKYSKLGWYLMGIIAVLWIVYNMFYAK